MKKLIYFIFLLVIPVNVFAYENDKFEISIPENMKEISTEDNVYKWAVENEEELPNLNIIQSKNLQYNIDLFNEQDIKDYETYIEEELNNELKEFDIKINVYDSEIVVINDYNVLSYKTRWETMESYGYDTFQVAYVYTTKNYLTTATFTAKTEEEIESDSFKESINSFIIKDDKIVVQNNNLEMIIIFAVGGGIIGAILSLIFRKRGRK